MMRIRLASLLTVCLTLGIARPGSAQVNYTRSTFPGTYTAITEAGGATDPGFTENNSTKSVALPFSMNWNGTPFTTANFIGICSNGFAFFSATKDSTTRASSPHYLFTTSNLGPNTIVAPWFANGLSVFAGAGNGKILTQLTAPQEFTIQWTDVWASGSTGASPTVALTTHKRINFQIKLYGSTHANKPNQIEFCYGPTSGTRTTNESASIGLKVAHQSAGSNFDAVSNSVKVGNAMMNTNQWPGNRFYRFTPATGTPTPIAAGTYTVGTGSSATYATLTEALADLNYRGISGAVTLNLTDAVYDSTTNYFPLLLGPVTGSSASNTLTIQSSLTNGSVISSPGMTTGNVANIASSSVLSGTEDPVLGLIGASYVTLKNISLESAGSSILVDRGLLVANASASIGATNNTIVNVKVRLNRENTGSIGISQRAITTVTSANGANSNNKYLNLRITNAGSGLQLSGQAAFADQNTEVGIVNASDSTVIGDNVPNDIGGGSTAYGIQSIAQNMVKIHHTTIRNIFSDGTSGAVSGISCGESTSEASVRNYQIYNNRIYNISQLNTGTTSSIVYGIHSVLTNNATSVSRIYNNVITGLQSASSANATRRIIGIMAGGSTGTTPYSFHIDFNTVILNPDNANCTNTCFEISSATSGNISQSFNVRNNIFANFTGNQTGSFKHYAWSSSSATSIGTGVSNRNILHIANPDNGFIGRGAGTDFQLLSAWKGIAAGVDQNSRSEDPQFISLNDYRINATVPTPAESNGSYFSGTITWVTTDFEGNTRHASAPDIGAYEAILTPFADNDLSPFVLMNPANEEVLLNNGTANAFKPVVRFKNNGLNPQTSIGVRYRISGPLPASTIVYNESRTLAALGSGATVLDTFPAVTLGTNGTYVLEAITELGGDNVLTNDTLRGTLVISAPLSGPYTIGQASAFPYNTLTNAIRALNNCGVSAPATFLLADAEYSANETFPLEIRKFAGASASATVTIKPATGVNATIQGNSGTFILKLADASYTIIDGSNTVGGTTRDLAIVNNNASAGSGSVWISSSAAGANPGATNNTIKNTLIRAGVNNVASTFGVLVAGTTSTGTPTGVNNDNTTIQNNRIERAYRGIYARATTTSSTFYDNLLIADNEIGSDSSQNYVLFRGIDITGNINPEIRNNRIYNMMPGENLVAAAIELGANTRNARVHRNRIDSIGSNGASSGTGAYGIAVTGSSADSVLIYNNFISTVAMNMGGTGTTNVANGIRLAGGTRIYVQHNSVNMGGVVASGTSVSAALMVTANSVTPLYVNNNVLVNHTIGTAVKSYPVYAVTGTVFANINHNVYYAGSPNGVLGFIGTDLLNMNEWRAATQYDLNSFLYNPAFVSSSDLHIPNGTTSPLESAASPISYITRDIDDSTRTTTPDIGADEFSGTAIDIAPPGINFTPLTKTAQLTNRVLMASISDNSRVDSAGATKPRIYYKKSTDANTLAGNSASDNGWKYTEATNIVSPFRLVIDYTLLQGGAASSGDVIQYFVVAGDLAASQNVGVKGAEFAATPASVNLVPADFPVTVIESYPIVSAIPAVVLVGDSQTYKSLSGTGGLFEAINNQVLSSDVQVRITSDLAETGLIDLNEFKEDGAGNYTITIGPDTNQVRTLSGSITRNGLINLNGADRVVLDGRFNGSGNYLTIINNATGTLSSKTAVINIYGPGNNANPSLEGAVDVVVRNCNIVGGTMFNTNSSNEGFMGIYIGSDVSGGTSIPAASFNNRVKVIENRFARMGTGIYLLGNSNATFNTIEVEGNEFGTTKEDSTIFFQAMMILNSSLKAVRNNLHDFVQNHNTYNTTMYGMQISGCNSAEIAYNTIRNFKHLKGGTIYGIQIGSTSTSNDANTVLHDNLIYNLYSSNATASVNVQAINISSKDIMVYHNSINLFNTLSATNGGSAAIYGAQTGTTGLNIRNNAISNTLTPVTAARSYGLYMSAAAFGTSNYNNIYVGAGTTGRAGSTDYTTLALWRTATSQDLNSVQLNPLFNNDSLLVPYPNSPLKAAGVSIPAVPRDFNDTLRSATPTIGAYEKTADLMKPVITYVKLGSAIPATQRTTSSFATIADAGGSVNMNAGLKPRIYYKRSSDDNTYNDNTPGTPGWKYSETFSTGSPFDFEIDYSLLFGSAPVTAGSIQYFVIAQDTAPLPNVAVNGATPAATPASVNLTAANFPVSGPINYYLVTSPLSGTYQVGITGTFPTLTGDGGAFEAINTSTLAGPVELVIASDLSENGTHPLNAWSETGTGNYHVHIVPLTAAGAKQITGSSKTPLILINGADRVKISGYDGLNHHSLVFTNTDTAAVIALTGQAMNDTITDIVLRGNTPSLVNGLLSVTNGCDSLMITDNLFAHQASTPGNALYFGGTAGTNDQVTITGNQVTNFASNGILVAATGNGNGFVIRNNSFYHNTTADITSKAAINFIPGAASLNDSISGNVIGGSAINAGGTPWLHNGAGTAVTFKGISANAGDATNPVVITGNTIRNLKLTGTAAGMTFTGIEHLGGKGIITSNVIGDSLNTDSIQIYGNAGTTVNIGISTATGNDRLVANNRIWSISGFGTGSNSVTGINIGGNGKPEITGNTIYNLYSAGSEVSQTGGRSVTGIFSGSDNKLQVIRKNLISQLVNTGGAIPSGNAATIARGIMVNSVGSGGSITQNNIRDIINRTQGAGEIHGVYFFTGGSGARWTIDNNMMYLTNGTETNAIRIEGVHDRNAQAARGITLLYNTIYIGGTADAAGTASSACYQRLIESDCRLENNLFYNERTGGTGKHTAISNLVGSANWTAATSNYNLYVAADTLSLIEWGGAGSVITPDSLRKAGQADQFSYFAGRNDLLSFNLFNNISAGDLSIGRSNYESWAVNGKGRSIDTITYSFFDSVRTAAPGVPTDIGADELTSAIAPAVLFTNVTYPVTNIVLYGRTLASINWTSGIAPALIASQYYSGVAPATASGGRKINSYTEMTASGGSAYVFDLAYAYSPAETGSIAQTDLKLAKTTNNGTSWDYFSSSVANTTAHSVTATGLTSLGIVTLTDQNNPLPVKLSNFTAQLMQQDVAVLWSTASERNASHFLVQASADGKTFATVGRVKASGNTSATSTYRFTHANAQAMLNNAPFAYYRLISVDANGASEASGTARVQFDATARLLDAAVAYPNPFSSELKVAIPALEATSVTIELTDLQGRSISSQPYRLEAGMNDIGLTGLEHTDAGVYFVRILAPNEARVIKVIKN